MTIHQLLDLLIASKTLEREAVGSFLKKDQVWQRPQVQNLKFQLHVQLKQLDWASPKTFECCVNRAVKTASLGDYASQLDGYLLLVEASKLARLNGDFGQRRRALRLARAILNRQAIHPTQSRLSFLHREILLLESDLSASEGSNWLASWQHFLATQNDDPPDFELSLIQGDRFFRLSDSGQSSRCYKRALELAPDKTNRDRALLSQAKVFRMARNWDKASETLNQVDCCLADWERACLEACQYKTLSSMAVLTRKKPSLDQLVLYVLWAKASREKRWEGLTPPFRTLVRRKISEAQPAFKVLLEVLLQLDHLQGSDESVYEKMRLAGEPLEKITRVETLEQELLLWAVACRWLIRVRQRELFHFCFERYRFNSLRLSNDVSEDALNLFDCATPQTSPDSSKSITREIYFSLSC